MMNTVLLTRMLFILQPSTAGDVSNSESDECEPAVENLPQSEPVVEPVERWRSFSEGEQVHRARNNWLSNMRVFSCV